ncbi:hypothetical protein AC578_6900 [Pseudocercospora eumusae]|uniref:Uncharacterized protein n=1 Tax=Pseudocercospora eumusae TaxID=321146 RepID=A0A139H9S9_9PEZI|nr:hypothetical protein AC578_6900 [Pseudocercospora eumusae]
MIPNSSTLPLHAIQHLFYTITLPAQPIDRFLNTIDRIFHPSGHLFDTFTLAVNTVNCHPDRLGLCFYTVDGLLDLVANSEAVSG